jgi:branched-chain amino acid transport system substrate-binding protein
MGLVYTGGGYDTVKILAQNWKTADPENFDAVNAGLRKLTYRGVNGFYSFNNPQQAPKHYPMEVKDLEQGMAHLFMQVQNGQHKIISPNVLKEATFKPAPWMAK